MNNRGIMSILNGSDSILPSVEEVEKAIPAVDSGITVSLEPIDSVRDPADSMIFFSTPSTIDRDVLSKYENLENIHLGAHAEPVYVHEGEALSDAKMGTVSPISAMFNSKQLAMADPQMQPLDHSVSQYDLSSLNIRQPCKRGDVIRYMDVKAGLQEVEGMAIAVQMLPVPTEYQLVLVRGKNRFDVIVHKADWLNMADNIRNVENEALSTVESFMAKKTVNFLTVAGGTFGGKSGFSPDFVANRLWKPICGKKLKPIDLMV